MARSRLRARFPMLCAALLVAAPAFAQDQPKGKDTRPPPAAAAKPAPPSAAPAVARPPTPKNQADSLLGKEVYGADGAQMGLVTNVLIDRDGHPIALVIDFGGFLGVGSRKIAIDWHLMRFHPGDKDKPVTLSLSKDQLKSAPEYKPDKAAAQIVHGPSEAKPVTPAKRAPPEADKPPAKSDHNESK